MGGDSGPPRATREFVLFDESDVGPFELRKVVERAAARDAAAYDDGFRFTSLFLGTSFSSAKGTAQTGDLEGRQGFFAVGGDRDSNPRPKKSSARSQAPAPPLIFVRPRDFALGQRDRDAADRLGRPRNGPPAHEIERVMGSQVSVN
jgi:hypothetical protein